VYSRIQSGNTAHEQTHTKQTHGQTKIRNSSGDELPEPNVLYDDIVHVLQNKISRSAIAERPHCRVG